MNVNIIEGKVLGNRVVTWGLMFHTHPPFPRPALGSITSEAMDLYRGDIWLTPPFSQVIILSMMVQMVIMCNLK